MENTSTVVLRLYPLEDLGRRAEFMGLPTHALPRRRPTLPGLVPSSDGGHADLPRVAEDAGELLPGVDDVRQRDRVSTVSRGRLPQRQ